jgi:hypothetical protein
MNENNDEIEIKTFKHRSRVIEIIKGKSGMWYYAIDDQSQAPNVPRFKTVPKAFVAARTIVDAWYTAEGPEIGPCHER